MKALDGGAARGDIVVERSRNRVGRMEEGSSVVEGKRTEAFKLTAIVPCRAITPTREAGMEEFERNEEDEIVSLGENGLERGSSRRWYRTQRYGKLKEEELSRSNGGRRMKCR